MKLEDSHLLVFFVFLKFSEKFPSFYQFDAVEPGFLRSRSEPVLTSSTRRAPHLEECVLEKVWYNRKGGERKGFIPFGSLTSKGCGLRSSLEFFDTVKHCSVSNHRILQYFVPIEPCM